MSECFISMTYCHGIKTETPAEFIFPRIATLDGMTRIFKHEKLLLDLILISAFQIRQNYMML